MKNLLNTNNQLGRVILYSFLFSFMWISIFFIWLYLENNKEPYPSHCKRNLHEINLYLDKYHYQNDTYISYEDIERSEYDNWGRFVIANLINNPDTEKRVVSDILRCQYIYVSENHNPDVKKYWWANLSNEGCFPKNKLGPSVNPKTPIAGDAPDNHVDLDFPDDHADMHLVLLKNGEIKEAKRGSKLWILAYGGGNCLKPPGGD